MKCWLQGQVVLVWCGGKAVLSSSRGQVGVGVGSPSGRLGKVRSWGFPRPEDGSVTRLESGTATCTAVRWWGQCSMVPGLSLTL